MAQFARPDADVSIGGWTDNVFTSTTDLWNALNDDAGNTSVSSTASTPDDATHCTSGNNPANDVLEVHLGNPGDPNVSTGHVVRYRYQKSASGGAQIDMVVDLVQGTTVIASWSHTNISDVIAQADQTLTGTAADAISDYADLRLRFTANKVGGGAGRSGRVTWAEVEVPDAGTPPVSVGAAYVGGGYYP